VAAFSFAASIVIPALCSANHAVWLEAQVWCRRHSP